MAVFGFLRRNAAEPQPFKLPHQDETGTPCQVAGTQLRGPMSERRATPATSPGRVACSTLLAALIAAGHCAPLLAGESDSTEPSNVAPAALAPRRALEPVPVVRKSSSTATTKKSAPAPYRAASDSVFPRVLRAKAVPVKPAERKSTGLFPRLRGVEKPIAKPSAEQQQKQPGRLSRISDGFKSASKLFRIRDTNSEVAAVATKPDAPEKTDTVVKTPATAIGVADKSALPESPLEAVEIARPLMSSRVARPKVYTPVEASVRFAESTKSAAVPIQHQPRQAETQPSKVVNEFAGELPAKWLIDVSSKSEESVVTAESEVTSEAEAIEPDRVVQTAAAVEEPAAHSPALLPEDFGTAPNSEAEGESPLLLPDIGVIEGLPAEESATEVTEESAEFEFPSERARLPEIGRADQNQSETVESEDIKSSVKGELHLDEIPQEPGVDSEEAPAAVEEVDGRREDGPATDSSTAPPVLTIDELPDTDFVGSSSVVEQNSLQPENSEAEMPRAMPQVVSAEHTADFVRAVPTIQGDVRESAVAEEPGALGPEMIRQLLLRARMELAAGDIALAHAFAEAAAEIEVPFELFKEQPRRILDEIEFVTSQAARQSEIQTIAYLQAVPPAPIPYEEGSSSENQSAESEAGSSGAVVALGNPTGWRAIGRDSLSIRPKVIDDDGERQLVPERRAAKGLSQVPRVAHAVGHSREWTPISYSWEAAQLKYNPLYFEDPQLERYGNEVCLLQPFLSGARFYATLPTLPYQMMSEGNSPCHEVYDLGYDRPGNCVPVALEAPPFSWTGSLATGGWAYALIIVLP